MGITIHSRLIRCHMCTGAIVWFGITKVVVGESETFKEHVMDLLAHCGVKDVDLDFQESKDLQSMLG